MLFITLLISVLLSLRISGHVLDHTGSSLLKRAPHDPVIRKGDFDEVQEAQIRQGFRDACLLAHAALNAAEAGNPIFRKYFPESTAKAVHDVFHNILWSDGNVLQDRDDDNNNECAEILSRVTVRDDFKNPLRRYTCTRDENEAGTYAGDTMDPVIVMCQTALKHGGINQGFKDTPYGDIAAVTCASVGDGAGGRVTWRMDTIGSILLHEYTHWGYLAFGHLGHGTSDQARDRKGNLRDAYGPFVVQQRVIAGSEQSASVADSYSWFASESFWSAECGKSYAKAMKDDGLDPECNYQVCEA